VVRHPLSPLAGTAGARQDGEETAKRRKRREDEERRGGDGSTLSYLRLYSPGINSALRCDEGAFHVLVSLSVSQWFQASDLQILSMT
jgi:hypothetical protein